MDKIKRLSLFILLIGCSIYGQAHSKVDSWREHYSYLAATKLGEWQDELVVVTPEGLMAYSYTTGAIRLLSSLTGLTEKKIVDIGFDPETQSLLVCYSNGAIDVLWNDKLFPIKDIKLFGSGNHYCTGLYVGSQVYVYGSFGVAVVDVVRREIKDNFWPMFPIDPDGITGMQEYNGKLFVSVNTALYSIDSNSPLKSDPAAWKMELTGANVNSMVATEVAVFVATEKVDGTSLLRQWKGGVWSDYYSGDSKFMYLSVTPDAIWAMGDGKMQRIHKTAAFKMNEWTSYGPLFPGFEPRMLIQKNGKRWIADAQLGLIVWNNDFERIRPIRPDVLNQKAVDAGSGAVWVLSAGMYAKYAQNTWSNTYEKSLRQAVCLQKNPSEDDGFVVGTSTGKLIKRTAQAWDSLSVGAGNISALHYDRYENLWGIRSAADGPVFVERNGQVLRLNISSLANANASEMVYDSYGIMWTLFPNKGILAVQATGTSLGNVLPQVENLRYRLVSAAELGITGYTIRSIASDLDGVLWIGTNGGIFAVYNAASVFDGNLSASRVMVKTNITGQGAYLLETEVVSDIEVDGANRKWFATETSGLYLQSANGTSAIQHYTPENSPLPSTLIQELCLEPRTGELFVYTDAGMLSYMPDASEASSTFAQAKVFPNPVRPDYTGNITLSGLKENTRIKVTDIAGDLCAEGVSNGGIWVWNGKTFKGKRPATGVYLFFLSDQASEETKILKLLFVH